MRSSEQVVPLVPSGSQVVPKVVPSFFAPSRDRWFPGSHHPPPTGVVGPGTTWSLELETEGG